MLTENLEKIVRDGKGFHEFKRTSGVAEFPDHFARFIKSFGEVYFWKKGNFHVITRAQHAKEILTSPAYTADRGSFFVSRMPDLDLGLVQDFFGVVKKMMVMSDDEDHSRRRKAAAAGFEDAVLERFEQTMQDTVKKLVADLKGKGRFDFVADVSSRLPSTVLADLFSISESDREDFLRWSNIMTGFFGGAAQYTNQVGIEANSAAIALKNYFSKLIEERKRFPGQDYVSILLENQKKYQLSHDELISQLVMMLVAGMATTTDQLNNTMFLLASRPEIQNEVHKNPDLIPQMIEECKRYDPAVTFIFRVARAETRVGSQPIAVGDVIFISTHAVNRDLPEQDRPFELDIHRRAHHFAYGYGAHYCIGAKLARMEMTSLFKELISQLPPLRLDPERPSERDHYSASFSGFKNLYLKA